MTKLTPLEIYNVARKAGFTRQQAVTWTAIAMAESGGNPNALNKQGEYSVGLWQINVNADPGRATRYGNLRDPLANARAAYEISRQGRDMRPWTVTHDSNRGTARDYRRYLPTIERLTGIEGDDRGVRGYGAPLPPPLPESGSPQTPDSAGSGHASDLDRVTFGGKTVDRRTAAMLKEAERIANEQDPTIGKFRLSQGSWSHASASAGTHEGPGAFDMLTRGYTEKQKHIIGMALRQVGFASWRRYSSQGPWPEHWHGIAIGTKGLPAIARSQVEDYLAGRDGLAGHRKDNQPRPEPIVTWEQYQQTHPDAATPADQSSGSQQEPPTTDPTQTDPYAVPPGHPVEPNKEKAGDADQDGLVDEFEKLVNADPSKADTDGDGLSDRIEIVRFHTDPSRADTDADGMTDGAEVVHGTTPGLAAFKFRKKDSDKDLLPDDLEKLIGTDPEASDSDHDGVADSLELSLGFDPLKWDTDGDGFSDGLERPAPTGVGTPAAPDANPPPDAPGAP